MVPCRIFQMDGSILLKSLKPDTVDWRARPAFVSCFTNPAVPQRWSLFQGCHWIASKPFPEAPRSLDKRCFHSTTSGRRWRREPFEITVPMKRVKLWALRSDSVCTRERGDHPYAATAVTAQTHTARTHKSPDWIRFKSNKSIPPSQGSPNAPHKQTFDISGWL